MVDLYWSIYPTKRVFLKLYSHLIFLKCKKKVSIRPQAQGVNTIALSSINVCPIQITLLIWSIAFYSLVYVGIKQDKIG